MVATMNRTDSVSALAEALLRAWVCGDISRLETELRRSESVLEDEDGEEGERFQLLKAVAVRMRTCPDVFVTRAVDPRLHMCLRLLAHLACWNNHVD